jgi:hypothetical protein
MKKALLHILLFSYVTVIIKPVMPSLSDLVAHVFWYSHHMATVHYEHGKYHVHYDYLEAAKKESKEKTPAHTINNRDDNEHLAVTEVYFVALFFSEVLLRDNRKLVLVFTCLHTDYPPPDRMHLV